MMTFERAHIPQLPAFILYLRYSQLLVAVAVLGLTAYVVTYFAYSGASLSLFTASTPTPSQLSALNTKHR